MRRRWLWVGISLILVVIGLFLALQTPSGRAAYHVADFRLRRWRIERWGRPTPDPARLGALAGRVTDEKGRPLAGAVVLVAEATGEVHYRYTDDEGRYRITGVPAGRYVPAAAAWGYEIHTRPAVRIRPRATTGEVNFTLRPQEPFQPTTGIPVTVTARYIVTDTFPTPDTRAERIDLRYRYAGAEVTANRIYQPVGRKAPGPTLVMAFPSDEPHWEPAAVAFASQGFTVLHLAPVAARGLDIQAHARDLLQAIALLEAGRLTPTADPDRLAVLAGSFSTLYFYQALPHLSRVKGVIAVGGISDGFLGVRSLYGETLEIPPPYDAAVAALGRPDRHPEAFLQYSPAFFARHMPPTLVVHTTADRVIPHNQALRFAQALAEANVPHELFLYEDVSHYLNTWDPTPQVAEAYWRMIAFLQRTIGQG